jgi:LysM repeat protein
MKTNRNIYLTGILLAGVLLVSACTQTYSQTPLGTPSLIPTGLFVSPFPSGQDPLKIIADLGTQTGQAQTAEAGGTTVMVTGTPGTPTTQSAVTVTGASLTPTVGTPDTQSAVTLLPVTIIPGGSTFTPTSQAGSTVVVPTISSGTVGPVPASYTLQKGEWPYCIARRFNVNPDELLTLNGLSVSQSSALMPGLVLSIPKTGDPFPADRAWHPHTHGDSFTVQSSGTTIYDVACYFGDVDPVALAAANHLSVSSVLTTGQALTIP